MKPKILIIGLDGVSWDVIDLMISRGIMPNLKTLKEQGAYSDMESTFPPMTTVAWATFLLPSFFLFLLASLQIIHKTS